MRRVIIVVLVCCIVSVVFGDGSVEDLTDVTFDKQVNENSAYFVKFYAPWCGHCKRLAPTWKELAGAVDESVKIAHVDCTKFRPLCSRFNVRGFPTLLMIRDGNSHKFAGKRGLDDLKKFAEGGYKSVEGTPVPPPVENEGAKSDDSKKKATEKKSEKKEENATAGGSDVRVLTDSTFEADTQASTGSTTGAWLVEFYAPWCGHCKKLAPTWEKVATSLKGKVNVAKVDCTVEKSTCARFNIRGFPTVKLLKNGKAYDYKGARTVEEFSEFASKPPSDDAYDVPGPLTMSTRAMNEVKEIVSNIKQLVKRQFNEVVIIGALGVVFGIVLAMVLFVCCIEKPPKVVYVQAAKGSSSRAKPPAAAAAAESDDNSDDK